MAPKTLVETSASFGRSSWEFQPPLDAGNLSVMAVDGERALVFSGPRPAF